MQLALVASYLGADLDRRYRLERLLGEGASSWVFAARDLRLEREVAVKVLKPRATVDDAEQRARFQREGKTLARLAHPHIVALHDAGETSNGLAYLVMELSRGPSLETELIKRGHLELTETLQLVLPLFGALACVHDHGIVHRDLKPANVALTLEHGQSRAKLLDFGIAKSGPGETGGAAMGTPAYMPPEQARAEKLGPEADVWSMAVLIFQCLSGRLPFDASHTAGILYQLISRRAPTMANVCPTLPPRVALAIDRALEPNAKDRYPNMRSFARALAIACRQDGVPVSRTPENIGLPQFGEWLDQADLELTRSTDLWRAPGARAPAPSAETEESKAALAQRKPLRGWRWATFAVLLGAASLTFHAVRSTAWSWFARPASSARLTKHAPRARSAQIVPPSPENVSAASLATYPSVKHESALVATHVPDAGPTSADVIAEPHANLGHRSSTDLMPRQAITARTGPAPTAGASGSARTPRRRKSPLNLESIAPETDAGVKDLGLVKTWEW